MTRFLSPMRGESGSANRQTTTCPLRTVIAAWLRSSMQSSRLREGLQWNIPVESYFISVFSKSKSFAWSSAIPTWRPPLLLTFVPPEALLVGLKKIAHYDYTNEVTYMTHLCLNGNNDNFTFIDRKLIKNIGERNHTRNLSSSLVKLINTVKPHLSHAFRTHRIIFCHLALLTLLLYVSGRM